MFALAILIGIYSYLIFALGLSGLLYKSYVIWMTIIYLLFCIFWYRRSLITSVYIFFERAKHGNLRFMGLPRRSFRSLLAMTSIKVFLGLIIVQALINLVGSLGPELGFDALWYHLTLPKLYLENHSVFYIPGGLLYYSLMPKLTEMLYVAALALNGEILAKLIHFSFGILTCIALYKLCRLFFSSKISLVAVVIFYSNLVVGWQSITAYVDLARTFFEIMALWGFVRWWKRGEKKWLIESAVMLGLAISTKLLALGSLVIFTIFFMFLLFFKRPPPRSPFGHLGDDYFTSEELKSKLSHHLRWLSRLKRLSTNTLIYSCITMLIPLPWFVFSYINTGNPIYPFFTDIYQVGLNLELLNPFRFIREIWSVFMESPDPISPVYIIFLPLTIILFKKFKSEIKLIAIYSFLAILVWYFTPRTGGGRFILPYLPAFSLLIAAIIDKLSPPRRSPSGHLRGVTIRLLGGDLRLFLVSVVIIVSVISILYRGIANSKYITVIIGTQTKSEFLSNNLNFTYGDFYDTDGYFKKNLKPSDNVLLFGFHNLYYVDFPFVDSSWVKKGDSLNYIAVQNAPSVFDPEAQTRTADGLPKKFKDWELIYYNPKTNVKLYSKGGIKWPY